jgi:uncharacterized lipoprotein YddW (UPF0748 family)
VIGSLADSGFNAVFASFSSGVVAHYPSRVLSPQHPSPQQADPMAAAIRAANDRGVELHAWRIGLALQAVPPDLLLELEADGRLQRNREGRLCRDDPQIGMDWLCPSHPANRTLEKAAGVELVERYDVAGVQLGALQFAGADCCFCDQCRERFQREANVAVEEWPADVLENGSLAGRWRRWRRELLTGLAIEISQEIRRADPDVYVSLAAWPDPGEAERDLGQDWPGWIRAGVPDFVCPVIRTPDRGELARLLDEQLKATRYEVPLYPGLPADRMKSARSLASRVQSARTAGADGFVVYSYDSSALDEWLSALHTTVTAADPDPMPHRSPPAGFTFSGPAAEPLPAGPHAAGALAARPHAGGRRVVAGAVLEAELLVGWEPATDPLDESGAAQASAMLEHMMRSRDPIASYERKDDLTSDYGDEQRISGRIVVEDPSGRSRGPLGVFDTDVRFERQLRFAAPEGPFRIAVYGSTRTDGETESFVVRGPLLVGMREEQLRAEAVHAELEHVFAEACSRPELAVLGGVEATFLVQVTGPGGGDWWVRLADDRCESGAGVAADPDLTFSASAEDVLALAGGGADPAVLYESGRLKISGDSGLLRRLGGLYKGH